MLLYSEIERCVLMPVILQNDAEQQREKDGGIPWLGTVHEIVSTTRSVGGS